MAFEKTISTVKQEMFNLELDVNIQDSNISTIVKAIGKSNCSSLVMLLDRDKIAYAAANVSLHSSFSYTEAYHLLSRFFELLKGESPDFHEKLLKQYNLSLELEYANENQRRLFDSFYTGNREIFDLFKNLYSKAGQVFYDAVEYVGSVNGLSNDISRQQSGLARDGVLSTKEINDILQNYFEDNYYVEAFYDYINKTNEEVLDSLKKEKSLSRNASKRIAKLKEFLKLLESKEIINYATFEKCLVCLGNNSALKKTFVVEYQEFLRNKCIVLSEKVSTLSKDFSAKMSSVLDKYEIDFSEVPVEILDKIFNLDLHYLKKVCGLLYSKGLKDGKVISYILLNSSEDIVTRLCEDINAGILNKEYIFEHLNIFSIEEDAGFCYEKYYNNFKLFKYKQINPAIFLNDNSVFYASNGILYRNILILENYRLISNLKNGNNYSFMYCEDLEKRLDALLELGLESFIESNIDILSYDLDIIKRLYLFKHLGIEVTNPKEVLDSNKPLVLDEELDYFVLNVVPYELPFELSGEYSYDFEKEYDNSASRTFRIEDVLFSRHRVLRNNEFLKDREDISNKLKNYYSLIMNGLYSFDELQIIKDSQNIQDERIKK